ncbi:MAG: sugar ABC transporter permease [Actinomycetales bacterium]|nr:sugar ABC transporter permease [Actinomycetales bacterium]
MATTTTTQVTTPVIADANDTRLRGGRWWAKVGWKHVLAVVIIAYAVFPLLYVLSASLSPGGTLTGSATLFSEVSGANYAELLETRFPTWMKNSLIVSSAAAVGTVVMGAAAAYAFSRFRFTGRRGGLTALLIIQMFPQMLAFVAIFLLLLTLGDVFPMLGIGQHLALIAVYLGGALGSNTFLMYGFFNTIPRELDEAAKIDGATHAQIFWGMVMRLVTPILAVVGLLSFVSTYGEFILARIVLNRPETYTLAVGLYVWASDERNAPWSLFAAGAVIAAIPIIALFMYLQKYIVAGLTAGSVKG